MRRARVDRNQAEVVEIFRKLGFTVSHTHMVGKGHPDILVGKNGVSIPVEIKDGDKPLSPDEKNWHENWRGSVVIVRSVDDVLKLAEELL